MADWPGTLTLSSEDINSPNITSRKVSHSYKPQATSTAYTFD